MDNTELFNVERFSDLKIKLSGGKLLSVHKVVVCRKIEYFDHLCGPNSRFAESNQEIVKLQDDSPVALKGLIRWAYGLPALEGATDTCTNWIDVRITADKYLASELSEESLGRSWEHARQIRTGEEILQVVEKITADGSHDVGLVGASERLYGVWFQEILKIPRFREELLGDKERMLGMIDDLSKGRSLTADQRTVNEDVAEDGFHRIVKWLYLCDIHGSVVLSEPPRNMERKTHSCTFCDFTNHTDEYVGTLLSPEYDGIPVLLPFDELD